MQEQIQQSGEHNPVPLSAIGQSAVRGATQSEARGRQEVLSFFDDARLAGLLFAELEKWRGTPFIVCPARARVGATCVGFVHGVLLNTGAIDRVDIPAYPVHGSGPSNQRLLISILDAIPRFRRIWQREDGERPALKPGDTIAVFLPKGEAHLAVVGRLPALWHCWAASGVTEGNLYDPIAERYGEVIYRPVAVQP